jgi:hypothetical protein
LPAVTKAEISSPYSGGHLMAADPSGGYWTVSWVGAITAHDGARTFGSPAASGTKLAKPIVDMAATPDGQGYWLVPSVLAVVGLMGTLVFGLLWAGEGGGSGPDPAMTGAARAFMTDLTNFNAKSIDADFNAITSMATGTFSGQASKFFNSSIRSQLQDAWLSRAGRSAICTCRARARNRAVCTSSTTRSTRTTRSPRPSPTSSAS